MTAEADLTKRERALITVPPYGTEVGESTVSAAATSLSHTLISLDVFRSHLVIQSLLYPDTLPYVYTRGHSTPRFSTLPPSLSFYPTSRHTTRMFVIPVIEPDLAERARIAAFNLDDYQDDPESPPPSPLYPYLFVAYQKMIAEADLTKRERALITVQPYRT
ncbi:hypothetical protein Tco_1551750 [Tanacetum coccineum]